MNDKINGMKKALESLEKLQSISEKPSSGAGYLSDLSEWIENELNIVKANYNIGGTLSYELKHVLGDLDGTYDPGVSHGMYVASIFIRERLEDCILGLQAAIQILEEEEQ